MSLTDDIDDIKMKLEILRLSQQGVSDAIVQMADKVDIIVSSGTGNTLSKPELLWELVHLFKFLAAGDKVDAWRIVLRLTDCDMRDARKIVEGTYESNHD